MSGTGDMGLQNIAASAIPLSLNRNRRNRSRLFWWFTTLSSLFLILTANFVNHQDGIRSYISLWLSIVFVFMAFTVRWSYSAGLNRNYDILEIPIYLSLFSLFLIQPFGLAPFIDNSYLAIPASESYLVSGLLLTGVGYTSMFLGYILVSKMNKTRVNHRSRGLFKTPSYFLTIIIYAGIFILRLGLIAIGSGENVQTARVGGDLYQWLVYLIELRWFFLALVSLQVFSRKWPSLLLILILVIEALMSLTSGWSSLIPKIFLLVFGCYVYSKRRIPWRTLLPAASVVIALIIFSIPVSRDLREVIGESRGMTLSDITHSIDQTWGKGIDNGVNLFWKLLVERQTAIAQTPAALMYLIPNNVQFLPVQDLIVAPFTFIPRLIWPSKPIYTTIQTWITVTIFHGVEGSGSSPSTIVGNAYMYGGWLVVITGMFVLGGLAALIYRWLALPGLLSGDVGLLAVYAGVVIANFHLGEGDFVSLWQGLVQRTFVFLVLAIILCRNKRTS